MNRTIVVIFFSFFLAQVLLSGLVAQVEVVSGVFPRSTATAIWFNRAEKRTLCRASLEHGAPLWQPRYRLQGFRGKRLRFGAGSFAELHLTASLKLGNVTVGAGRYALAFDCSDSGAWSIVLLDKAILASKKIAASAPGRTAGLGVLVPVAIAGSDAIADRLAVAFETGEPGTKLVVRWGPHVLRTDVAPADGQAASGR
ncbi:MAG: DUF2911 domain-containing protein [bacterium]|nr:DUF2911 domain-containing protein [bacterium]